MPLYEYECKQCHKHTEKRQKFSDVEITVCPHCGGVLQRVITAPSIAFKGGGWFKDGYGSVKPPASGEAGGGESKGVAENKKDSGSGDTASSKTDAAAAAPASAPAATPPAAPAASSAKD